MGTCKDDDTCEQSATKGEIESLKSTMNVIYVGFGVYLFARMAQ